MRIISRPANIHWRKKRYPVIFFLMSKKGTVRIWSFLYIMFIITLKQEVVWYSYWHKLEPLPWVKSEPSVTQQYITAESRTIKVLPLSVWENVIGGTVCVTCQLCSSLLALSPFSLATTSLPGKLPRSKIDLKVKHKRFPKGRGKINYDRWLFGLGLFWGRGAQDPINKLFEWKGEVGDR